jgi:hypothetical protein
MEDVIKEKGLTDVPFPSPRNPEFTFIDLFAGIGGFRIAMQSLGGRCVFSSEIDPQAARTYEANFGDRPYGDITLEETKEAIPEDFDILCGGFPCQAFSIAGKRLGFADETRGTLFFEVEDVLRRRQPKAFFLENVKGLVSHDHGKTLATILTHLDDAGYDVVPPASLMPRTTACRSTVRESISWDSEKTSTYLSGNSRILSLCLPPGTVPVSGIYLRRIPFLRNTTSQPAILRASAVTRHVRRHVATVSGIRFSTLTVSPTPSSSGVWAGNVILSLTIGSGISGPLPIFTDM